jgi:putative serine/threonine protein kinase
LSQQNISFSDELDIESPRLVPIISYPRFVAEEYAERISEMKSLGITSIMLGGKTMLSGTPVAGKGCVGLVVKAKIGSKMCALKIRRIDADRKSMDEEARLHKAANAAGVGPQLEGYTKNLLTMEFADGQSIFEWASDASKDSARSMTRAVLEQCHALDVAGLDHGELSRLDRHVIMSDMPCIIDFESASTARKTCNVTAAAQSIFLYSAVADRIKKILGAPDRNRVVSALRAYKLDQTAASFSAVLESLPI